jgi:hypothetical protein
LPDQNQRALHYNPVTKSRNMFRTCYRNNYLHLSILGFFHLFIIRQWKNKSIHTESNKIFEVLKSLYITFVVAVCRNASTLAASRATFKRMLQERGSTGSSFPIRYPVSITLPMSNFFWS